MSLSNDFFGYLLIPNIFNQLQCHYPPLGHSLEAPTGVGMPLNSISEPVVSKGLVLAHSISLAVSEA